MLADTRSLTKWHRPTWRMHWPVRVVLAVLSAGLLWSAFPPATRAENAWVALVPLLLFVRHLQPWQAATSAWFSGLFFWLATLSWFPAIIKNGGPWFLVVLGQVGLAAWCACFWGLFAYVSATLWQWVHQRGRWHRMWLVGLVDPLLWVGCELLRGMLFSGFAWNFVGVSQVHNLAMIQIAAFTGVYGVSALVMLINGSVATLLERVLQPIITRLTKAPHLLERPTLGQRGAQIAESLVPFALVLACWIWGGGRLLQYERMRTDSKAWRVALIQPNHPCVFSLNDAVIEAQLDQLLGQTQLAGAAQPDLIVWPETAAMGTVPTDYVTMAFVRKCAALGQTPLLTGVLECAKVPAAENQPAQKRYYNAAWMIAPNGNVLGKYHKQHLVPFGEYIPLDKLITPLQSLAPTGVSCTPGTAPMLLTLTHKEEQVQVRLGALICFEDTIPALSRAAVRAGAGILVLMTNDAWFDNSIEPIQHMQQSIFRAVENGVPLVRAANSGVSCAVDAVGRVTALTSGTAMMDFAGFMLAEARVGAEPLRAPYTRWGDWSMAYPGAFLVVWIVMFRLRRYQIQKKRGCGK